VIEPAGVAQDLHRYEQRKEDEQQIDVDRAHRISQADASACEHRKRGARGRDRQQMISQEPYLLPPPAGGFYYMKPVRLAIALVFILAVPAFAADRSFDLTGFAVYVDPNSSGTFNSPTPNQAFDINFNGKLGYGIGANIFFGNSLSAEFTVSSVKTEASFTGRARVVSADNPNLQMVPITGVLQWHFAPGGFIDPYIGAGVCYILFDNLNTASDFGNLGVSRIDFKDDAGLALNAGLGIRLTPRFAITVDGKYVPLKSSATAVFASGTTRTDVKINPVMVSAGLTLRF
jgi:outer membrane protein